jgi:hypothetical protein
MCTPQLRMVANALNKDPRTADKGLSYSLGIGRSDLIKRYASFGLGAEKCDNELPGS